MTDLSFDDFSRFLREEFRLPRKIQICESSLVEKDLGITGNDGDDLLKAIQKRYDVSFIGSDGTIRAAFGLDENQYLFHSEGFPIPIISALFGIGGDNQSVKDRTVGDLYDATLNAHARQHRRNNQ